MGLITGEEAVFRCSGRGIEIRMDLWAFRRTKEETSAHEPIYKAY
jgi:hypothetical protein